MGGGKGACRLGRAILLVTAAALGCRSAPSTPEGTTPPEGDWGETVRVPVEPFPSTEGEASGLLAPGDLLSVSVHGHPDLDSQVRIPPSGTVELPLIGPVRAKGETVPDFVRAIEAGYEKDFLTHAEVSVTVVEFSPREVYILGAVKKEGAYPIPTGKRLNLLQLLSLAGGFLETADQDRLVVIRRNGEEQRVHSLSYRSLLEAASKEGRTFLLQPDDTVIVGKEERVYVLGRVNHPGAFPIGEGGLTVIQAVSLAGGFERIASREGTLVIRGPSGGGRQTFRVPVNTIVSDDSRRDFRLQPGDIVYVPESLF